MSLTLEPVRESLLGPMLDPPRQELLGALCPLKLEDYAAETLHQVQRLPSLPQIRQVNKLVNGWDTHPLPNTTLLRSLQHPRQDLTVSHQ